jgi:hypothetical protein
LSGEDLGYRDDGEEAWNRKYICTYISPPIFQYLICSIHRNESSEDEFEEDSATAKKLGMVTEKYAAAEDKKQTGIQERTISHKRIFLINLDIFIAHCRKFQ